MAHIRERSAGMSDLANGRVTDHTASEIGRAITSVVQHDGLSTVLFGICVLALIFIGASTNEWLYAALFAFAFLIFYGLFTRNKIEHAKLQIQREQLQLKKGAREASQMQLPEPLGRPPVLKDEGARP